jgi:hypothetical protein
MTTVDLEKKLIEENRRLTTPKELLLINEYDKHAGLVDNEVLSRIGLNKQIKTGKRVKEDVSRLQKMAHKYNQERVFHISQIESICKKYHLRFLSAIHYNGIIDDRLPEKITNFEVAYGDKCDEFNTLIVAPKGSFNLEKKPKDPLMFYRINNEYYYLIHKWGNDLNIFRRLLPLLSNPWFSVVIVSLVFTLPLLLIPVVGLQAYPIVSLISFIVFFLYNLIEKHVDSDDMFRIVKQNDWDSHYEL